MKVEELQLLLIKGAIGELPPDQKELVMRVASELRAVLADNGDLGLIALGLVGAEEAAK